MSVENGSDIQNFCWPAPLSALYSKAEPWSEPQECELEGINGALGQCSLVSISPADQTIQIQIERTKSPITLAFSQFRRLTLKRPIYPNDQLSADRFPTLPGAPASAEYHLQLHDGSVRSGLTVGYVETSFGLFVFTPLDERGSVQRVFMPHHAFVRLRLTEHLGKLTAKSGAASATAFEALDKTEAAPSGHRPGDFLTEAAVVSPGQLMLALDHQSKMPAIRVGEALLRLGYVDENQLQQALAEQSGKSSKRVGELLIQAGVLSRRDLNTALAHKMGYPFVDVTQFPIEPAALEKIPLSTAQRLMVLPLLARSDLTVVAAADPTRREMVEELEFLLHGRVITTLGDENDIGRTMTAAYDRLAKGGWHTDDVEPKAEPPEPAVGHDLLESLELRTAPKAPAADPVPKVAESGPSLSKLIHTMITEAFARGVSDIHVETQAHQAKVRIRFRQDGLLAPYLELPHTYRAALVAHLKSMAELDSSQQHQPQNGKIDFRKFSPQHGLELRLCTIPTAHGLEDMVLHLLSSPKPLALDQLDLSPDNLAGLRQAVGQPVGMVLCAGPAGSGKTTTLHALLSVLNTPQCKIWTAEDPIEITQSALRQVQVNPKTGWTFAKALRTLLQADPDILMAGEINDAETARVAMEAALTGHLMLSSLRTHSAAEAVTRLVHMGMDTFNLADALLAVLAQRLTRRLCTKCRTQAPADEAYITHLLDDYLRAFPAAQCPPRQEVLAQWTQQYGHNGALPRYHAAGCSHCQGSGLSGRVGLHELMSVSTGMRRLIQTGAQSQDLVAEAFKDGTFRTLRQDGITKVLAGLTSMDEVRANTHV